MKRVLAFSIPIGATAIFLVFATLGRIEQPTFNQNRSLELEKKASASTQILSDVAPTFGPQNAKVTVVEFLDFQCPYCGASHEGVMEALKTYQNASVRFMFRQLPLTNIHPHALQAAHAALCAHEQNQYLAMQDLLFRNQDNIGQGIFTTFANTLEINLASFNTCMAEKKYQSIIEKDITDAQELQITGTPTWFINGERVVGGLSKEDLIALIEDRLNQ